MFTQSQHTQPSTQHNKSLQYGRWLVPLVLCTMVLSSLNLRPQSAGAISLHAADALLTFAQRYPDEMLSVIVRQVYPGRAVANLVHDLQGEVTQELGLINSLAVRLPGHALAKLAASPDVKWISPDAPIYKSDTGDGTVVLREDFDGVIYQAQSATDIWPSSPSWGSNGWQELGEGDGPNEGDIVIAPFLAGEHIGVRLQGAGKGMQTVLNLSDSMTASLALAYRRKDLDDANDFVAVELSSDEGANWTTLDRLSGSATDETMQVAQYDLTPYKASIIKLRLVASSTSDATDRVYIDYLQVSYTPKPDPQSPVFANMLFLPAVSQSMDAAADAPNGQLPQLPISSTHFSPQAIESTNTVVDYFEAASFCNNNGWYAWAACWVENDPGASTVGPTVGHVQLGNWTLRLDDYPDTGGTPSAARKVSLLNAASAMVKFGFWTSSGVDASDAIAFEVSTNNGASYTTLETYTGITGATWQEKQYDFSRFVPNEITVRFRVMSGYGASDEKFSLAYIRVWYDNVTNTAAWNVVVPSGSVWKYLDNGTNQGTAWRQTFFNDSTWSAGAGQLGYGDGDETTIVGYGSSSKNKYITTYFRRDFYIADVSSISGQLDLGMVRPDDGAVFYVNGTEVLRVNMPTGSVSYTTLASSAIDATEGAWIGFNVPITALVNGKNVIAVEVHQVAANSDDLSFEAELAAYSNCGECINTGSLATHLQSIRANQVWNSAGRIQGNGVTVAVVDSGIAPNRDLQNSLSSENVITRVNFVGTSGSIDDYNGHGSHVAGIIGGNGAQSRAAYMGVAPKAKLVDIKVLNDYGVGSMSAAVAGLQWIYDNRVAYNIKVVNLSLNSSVLESYNTSPLDAALEILWFNKIVVVVAVGNAGTTGLLFPPGNDPFVITVGAVDDKGTPALTDDSIATFSAYGTTADGFAKPDLVAPGRNITSVLSSDDGNLVLAYPANVVIATTGARYFKMSGTSMASGVVAGAAALLLQDEPNLNPDQVKYRLKATANTAWTGYNVTKAGAGYLDIYAAVNGTTTQTANTGIQASQALFGGTQPPVWGSVNWSSVNWSSVNWSSVNWSSVNWSSVNWSSVNWTP